MAYASIAHVSAVSVAGNTIVTAGIDTTGANLLLAWVANETGFGGAALTDSKGNTWTATTTITESPEEGILYYSIPSSVGAAHTFTATATGARPSIAVSAFSGSSAQPLDQQASNSSAAAGTTLTTGSITPTEAHELVAACYATRSQSGTLSIDGGFTIGSQTDGDGANNQSIGIAYLIQTAAAAANPTWTSTNSVGVKIAKIASFKIPSAGMFLVMF